MGGLFSASPVAADGKIYFVSETGEVIVLRSGREPAVIARNDVGERLIGSPAISNGQIFLRSDGRLFAPTRNREAKTFGHENTNKIFSLFRSQCSCWRF